MNLFEHFVGADVGGIRHIFDEEPQIMLGSSPQHRAANDRIGTIIGNSETQVLVAVGLLRIDFANQPFGTLYLLDLLVPRRNEPADLAIA